MTASPFADAVVAVGLVPVRAEPSHRSEMVTQWLCGEPLVVREEGDGWLRCRGPDGYDGWCAAGGILRGPAAEGWGARATGRSLGGAALARRGDGPERRLRIPWGARLAPGPSGEWRLPGDVPARPEDPAAFVSEAERPARFPAEGAAIVASARRWLGTPYLWGGRSELATDCSGLVQAVYALHGVPLPRDSGAQSRVGPEVASEVASGEGGRRPPELAFRAGDLLFFGSAERVTHVALAVEGRRILHAAEANGEVAEDDLDGDTPLARRLRDAFLCARRPLAAAPAGTDAAGADAG